MAEAPHVLIIGAGWIGRQVGLRMAICGLQVSFIDRSPPVLQDAERWLHASAAEYTAAILADAAKRSESAETAASAETAETAETADMADMADSTASAKLDAMLMPITRDSALGWRDRIDFLETVEPLVGRAQVVLECVPEQITLKRRILKDVSRRFSKTTIIASNSSYFTPSALSQFVESPERFVHWHFHVPLHRSSIADISGIPQTEPWVLERLRMLTLQIDQYPLMLRHEHPGYVFNWLLQSLLRSALELVAQDVVDIADIDRAWKAVSGMPIGPFAMMDNIGLDVIEQVLANARWDDAEPVAIERLLAVLREPISRGHLGVKSGQGFYSHPKS